MSDLSVYAAEQFVDWLSQGTIDTAPSNIYVALFDGSGTEVSDTFQNDRPATTAATDWTVVDTGFENATEITFGEAANDVPDITDVALYDADLATGGNELARYDMTDTPFDVSAGTVIQFEVGNLTFDVLDRTE